MRKTERSGDDLLSINPNPIMNVVREAPIVPNCKISFRPYLVSRNELIIDVTTCQKFIMDGKLALYSCRLPLAISPAQVDTALIPAICCRSERCTATYFVMNNLFLVGYESSDIAF